METAVRITPELACLSEIAVYAALIEKLASTIESRDKDVDRAERRDPE